MKLQIQKLRPEAKVPERAHESDAGYDLFAAEKVTVPPGGRALVPLGFAAMFPPGYVALFWDRSGLAIKHGITNLAGVIDSGYRGEWNIVLHNTNSTEFVIELGERVAQVLFQRIEAPDITEVEELPDSLRGAGGFGSTGK